jgi:hypothetical protein
MIPEHYAQLAEGSCHFQYLLDQLVGEFLCWHWMTLLIAGAAASLPG